MNFMEKRKQQLKIKSAYEYVKEGIGELNEQGKLVKGPSNLDCLSRRWHRGDLMTIIGAASVGKTTMNLYIIKSILENNPDGFCLFLATEMDKNTLLYKWTKLTQGNADISKRLYIHTCVDDEGNSVDMSMKGLISTIKLYKSTLSEKLVCVVLDHLNNITREIDESLDKVSMQYNKAIRDLDFFGILNAQTTKSLGGKGDKPIDKYGVFGTSKPTQDSTYMLSMCNPLVRVSNDPRAFPCTGFQYCKIRFKQKEDKLKEGINYLLRFNPNTEGYDELSNDDKMIFEELYPDVLELIKAEEKSSAFAFDTSRVIKNKNGDDIKIYSSAGLKKDNWE